MKKVLIIFLIILSSFFVLSFTNNTVYADSMSDTIDEQLNNLDLTELTEYLNSLNEGYEIDFYSLIKNILSGNNEINFNDIGNYFLQIFFKNFKSSLPTFLTIISLCILCSVINGVKSSFLSESVADTVFFICFLCILLLLSNEIISIYKNTRNIIEILTKTTEIMSPIISVLMIGGGGIKTAAFFKPVVLFLTGGVMTIVLTVIMPLIILQGIFAILGNYSENIKFNKLSDFFASIIKWVFGIIVTIYSLFLTIQGISTSTFDVMSIKVAKYTISNSVPIIGGFLGTGFDIIVAGSTIIKNSIGVAAVIILFYFLLSPVLFMIIYSLMLKLTAGIIQPIDSGNTSKILFSFSKTITYLIICILIIAFMFFITILFIIFSANAYL